MRKILFILIFVASVFKLSGQVYQPFPDSGATWKNFFVHYDGPQSRTEKKYSISTGADTILHGQTYRSLWVSGVETDYDDHGQVTNVTYFQNSFGGGLREDSVKRIYLGDYGEELLYDFSLNVNDSLTGNYLYNLPTSTYVSSIDSIFDGSIYRKQFHISIPNLGYDYIQLIEGIGSTWGLFNFFSAQLPSWGYLYCFTDAPSNLILDTTQCIATGIAKIEKDSKRIDIFPNPSGAHFFIRNLSSPILEWSVYNNIGATVSSGVSEITEFNLEGFPKGLYIYKVETKESVLTGRLIKQ